METKLKKSNLGKMSFISIMLFSPKCTPNLQARRKNIVETTRDRHGSVTKTPLE
jgi:hypothetical protein